MSKKALTTDCNTCHHCSVNEDSKFLCSWGKGKPKVMYPAKGKKTLFCNLIREEKNGSLYLKLQEENK